MRAALVAELPEGPAWQYEIKFDGYRALGIKTHGEVELLSRNNLKLNARFPKIAKALETLDDGTIVDGEVVAIDKQGRPAFNALQNSQRGSQPIFYYVFDLLQHRGQEPAGPAACANAGAMLDKLKLRGPGPHLAAADGERGRPGPCRARAGARRAGRQARQQHLRAGRAQRRVGRSSRSIAGRSW